MPGIFRHFTGLAACVLAIAEMTGPASALAGSTSLINTVDGYGMTEAERDITPLELGALFCKARQSGDMAALDPYLAPRLKSLLAGVPGDRAVPWQSYPGQPMSCSLSIVNGFDDTIGVLVAITYEAYERRWSDVLNLERTPDSWRLNNVFYQDGGNLRFVLFAQDD